MARMGFFEKIRIPVYDDPEQVQAGEITIDAEKCSNCRMCIRICPADALVPGKTSPVMRPPGQNECMGCADCAAFCAEQAITLVRSLRLSGRYKTIDHGELRFPRLA